MICLPQIIEHDSSNSSKKRLLRTLKSKAPFAGYRFENQLGNALQSLENFRPKINCSFGNRPGTFPPSDSLGFVNVLSSLGTEDLIRSNLIILHNLINNYLRVLVTRPVDNVAKNIFRLRL